MHVTRLTWIPAFLVVFLICLTPLGGFAAEIFVATGDAKADDKNPGTPEAPFKTIQAGLDKAQPGDTVQVRGGVYHEEVIFKHDGLGNRERGFKRIALEAYRNEHVVLDGAVTIPAEKWTLVEGCKNTYWAPFESQYDRRWNQPNVQINMLFCNGVMVPPTLKNVPGANSSLINGATSNIMPVMPDDTPGVEGWYHDVKQKKLFVNLGGRVPGKDAQCQVPELSVAVDARDRSCVCVRKLEIRNYIDWGIWADFAHEAVLEDNYIHHIGAAGIWAGEASCGSIRRNTITDTMGASLGVGGVRALTVEENVILRSYLNPYKIVEWGNNAIGMNGPAGAVLRNNIVADGEGLNALWEDCQGAGLILYGNSFFHMGAGFYIEAEAYGTVLQWNTVADCWNGVGFRENSGNVAFENYVHDCRGPGLMIGTCDARTDRKADSMTYNWVIDNGRGVEFGPNLHDEAAHFFDRNTYKFRDKGAVILQFGDKQYKDLAAIRSDLGLEMHGKVVDKFDPDALGLVTFRVPGSKRSWVPRAMFGNPGTQRCDPIGGLEPYFWRRGSFHGVEYDWRPAGAGWNNEGAAFCATTRGDASGFVRLAFAAFIKGDKNTPPDSKSPLDDVTAIRKYADDPAAMKDKVNDGLACLQAASTPAKAIGEEGYGYWGLDLPTTDGAQIDLSLWIRAKNVTAAKPNGGLYVLAEFRDPTGQNASRQYLAGAKDGDKPVGDAYMTGDYRYKKLAGTVTAPKGARWFKLGFGLRDCTGWAAFSDIDIQTRPGTPETETPKAPPIDAGKFNWTVCDLSGLLNRPLADEVDNDGKGGWTDQGPMMDLRGLQAGDYTWNNVAFRVAKGNACFIMKNKQRPSENLPDGGKVDLKAKADVLAFLHSGGWINADVQEATYILHYEDGTKVEIPVIGGKNILDWTAPGDRANGLKYDPALGLILPATTVPSPQFVHVTVWMVLWKNPHPDKRIASLEIKGANEGIPGLIAVSRGVAQ